MLSKFTLSLSKGSMAFTLSFGKLFRINSTQVSGGCSIECDYTYELLRVSV
jgi:hypothetical protein